MRNLFHISIILFIITAACNRNHPSHTTLLEINAIANAEFEDSARKILGTVDKNSLDEADRQFYDFLTIKTNDNRYMWHQSDSLAASITAYYGKTGDRRMKSEAYYYAGRVYQSIGDAPQAVDFFLKTIEELNEFDGTESKRDNRLKCMALYQLGQLLLRQRLYEQALPVVKQAYVNAVMSQDTLRIANDASIVGNTFRYLGELDSSKFYYDMAINYAARLHDKTAMIYNLKSLYAENGEFEKARQGYDMIIRRVPHQTIDEKNVLILGAQIYYNTGLLDSARYCVNEVLNNFGPENHRKAYEILLGINEKEGNADTLNSLIKKYVEASNIYYNTLTQNATAQQYSLYNYSVKDKKIKDLKISQQRWHIIIVTLCLAFASSIIAIIGLLYVNNKKKLNLSIAYNNIQRLESILNNTSNKNIDDFNNYDSSIPKLAELLKKKIERLQRCHNNDITIPQQITTSDIYKELKSMVLAGRTITNQQIFNDLDRLVMEVSPSFKRNLIHLLPSIGESEYQICLLVKCGFSPTEISKLISKSLSAVSCARSRMFERAFHYKEPPATWDLVINII